MDKSTKMYGKALECYQDGYIDKALKLCEESISLNYRNSASLNLKGLLLYMKGDLEGARSLWSINKDVNRDEVSKKYLKDSQKDEERKGLYAITLELIKNIRIKEAIVILKQCEESDYNIINVSNALASCLIKQGRYEEAMSYIKKVLSIDKINAEARENQKMLIEYGVIADKEKGKKNGILAASVLAIILLLGSYFIVSGAIKDTTGFRKFSLQGIIPLNKKESKENTGNTKNESNGAGGIVTEKNSLAEAGQNKSGSVPQEAKENKSESANIAQSPKPEEEVFPKAEINTAIDKKDYYSLFNYVSKWEGKKLGINETSLLAKARDVLKLEGTSTFYGNGLKSFKSNSYEDARNDFNKAYSYGKDSELYPHIIYMLGATYNKLSDTEKCIEMYEKYINTYSDGTYSAEVCYQLAIIYKNLDIRKSKDYAQKIVSKYSDSMYNNTNIKQILAQ